MLCKIVSDLPKAKQIFCVDKPFPFAGRDPLACGVSFIPGNVVIFALVSGCCKIGNDFVVCQRFFVTDQVYAKEHSNEHSDEKEAQDNNVLIFWVLQEKLS